MPGPPSSDPAPGAEPIVSFPEPPTIRSMSSATSSLLDRVAVRVDLAVVGVPVGDRTDRRRARRVAELIVAGPAGQQVGAETAVERVVAGTAVEAAVAGVADQRVVAVAAGQPLDVGADRVVLAGLAVVGLPVEVGD